MQDDELYKAAVKCLAKAFKGEDVPPFVVQAAVSIVQTFN